MFIEVESKPEEPLAYWYLDEFTVVTYGNYHYVCSKLTLNEGVNEVTNSCKWVHKKINIDSR